MSVLLEIGPFRTSLMHLLTSKISRLKCHRSVNWFQKSFWVKLKKITSWKSISKDFLKTVWYSLVRQTKNLLCHKKRNKDWKLKYLREIQQAISSLILIPMFLYPLKKVTALPILRPRKRLNSSLRRRLLLPKTFSTCRKRVRI